MHSSRDGNSREDQFLATLAHELRNPLAPMRYCVGILERTCDQDAGRQAIQIMDRQLRQMTRLVDELLEVSRVTRGKIELRCEPVDLGGVLASAVETSRPAIEAEGHALTVLDPAPPLTVDADPMRLAQVISNLLDNAARFTDPGGRIELEAHRDGGHAVIDVTDSGVGISADALPDVFELFSQADKRALRSNNGLGIGLALVRSLVELHGGEVSASSPGPGRGSRFEVRLPLRPTRPREARLGGGSEREIPGMQRVVVVDDNRDAADTLATLLRIEGAEVRVAYDGPTALNVIEDFRPRAVVLDLGMPGMDGYEVARWIRHRKDLDGLTLIALTGWGAEADRRLTAEAGFDHHLIKPAGIDSVQAVLSRLT
jgi:CheY-like chemotaxis protein/two-component sensor histidine kinase